MKPSARSAAAHADDSSTFANTPPVSATVVRPCRSRAAAHQAATRPATARWKRAATTAAEQPARTSATTAASNGPGSATSSAPAPGSLSGRSANAYPGPSSAGGAPVAAPSNSTAACAS